MAKRRTRVTKRRVATPRVVNRSQSEPLHKKYLLPAGGGAATWLLSGSALLGVAAFGAILGAKWFMNKSKKKRFSLK